MESSVQVLFDATPEAWADASALQAALAGTVFALNMHVQAAADARASLLLYSQAGAWCAGPVRGSCERPLSAAAVQALLQAAVRAEDRGSGGECACAEVALAAGGLAAQLSRALCAAAQRGDAPGAVLVVAPQQRAPLRYVPLMNCGFAAARLGVPIDVVLVGAHFGSEASGPGDGASQPSRSDGSHMHPDESAAGGRHGLLRQVSRLSGGVFVRLPDGRGVARVLAQFAGVSPAARRSAVLPGDAAPCDMRPACFCHGRPVPRGHVCSVCLSVFCAFSPVCPTCRAKVDFRSSRA